MKHACRRMKHFAALPQNMKHRRCGMKQSLTASFRHFFGKKMAEELGFEPREGRPSAVFKTAALNHSTILPLVLYL